MRTTDLSSRARAALLNTTSSHVGVTIGDRTPDEVVVELTEAGLIGAGRGLTRAGSILREALMDEALGAL